MSGAEIRAEGRSAAWDAASRPFVSVVLPTFRRTDTLGKVLGALAEQDASALARAEVVVCDDGSGDATETVLREAAGSARYPLAWVSLARNGGPARARNEALRRARGAVVLLIGDDIVPGAGFLDRHVRWHERHPEPGAALLGLTTWPPELASDPFLRWLEHGGRRYFFNYRDLPEDRPASAMHFYTCNVSFKRALLDRAGPFDEDFPFASHEDLELGWRLERAGMRLWFDRGALAHHWHRLDFPGTFRRVYRMGHSSVRFWSKVPDTSPAWRRALRPLLAGVCGLRFVRRRVRADLERVIGDGGSSEQWLRLLHFAYWCGAADARRGRVDPDLEDA